MTQYVISDSFKAAALGNFHAGLIDNPQTFGAKVAPSKPFGDLFANGASVELTLISATLLAPEPRTRTAATTGERFPTGRYNQRFEVTVQVGTMTETVRMHACDVAGFTAGKQTFTGTAGHIGNDTSKPYFVALTGANRKNLLETAEFVAALNTTTTPAPPVAA